MQQAKHHRCDEIAPVLRHGARPLSKSFPGGQSSEVCDAVTGFLKASQTVQCHAVALEMWSAQSAKAECGHRRVGSVSNMSAPSLHTGTGACLLMR